MSNKLQELTERLYHDGVEKARREADGIIDDAEQRSRSIEADARAKAESIVAEARKDAEEMRRRTENELATAAERTEAMVRQRIASVLADGVLADGVASALKDVDFVRDLIGSAVDAWKSDGSVGDIEVLIPSDRDSAFETSLRSALKARMDEEPAMTFSDRLSTGFRIVARDGSYAVSFTQEDFEEFFRSFLKDRTRSLLYG